MGQGSLVRRASLPVYGEGGPKGFGWGSPREPHGLDRGKALSLVLLLVPCLADGLSSPRHLPTISTGDPRFDRSVAVFAEI